jgi:predicted outer membrane protein
VGAIEEIVAQLKDDREAQALAEEGLGAARGHLETLEELAAETAKHGISWAKP